MLAATPGKWAQNPKKKWTLSKKPTVSIPNVVKVSTNKVKNNLFTLVTLAFYKPFFQVSMKPKSMKCAFQVQTLIHKWFRASVGYP